MLEDRKSRSSRKTPDLVADELILILHEAGMLEFNDIFQRTVAVMKEKHMSLGGEEILRLRIYEKLQNLVSAGGLMKRPRIHGPPQADGLKIIGRRGQTGVTLIRERHGLRFSEMGFP